MLLTMLSNQGTWVGRLAPDFKLQNQDGIWITLDDLLQPGPLMLAFYPGDFTPVCTRQLCSYQEAFEQFVKYGIQVVGISPNAPESHIEFIEKYHFTFPLLSDPGKETIRLYGVTSLFMLGGMSRAVFILGKDKKVRYRYVEPTPLTRRKPDELLRILDDLHRRGKV